MGLQVPNLRDGWFKIAREIVRDTSCGILTYQNEMYLTPSSCHRGSNWPALPLSRYHWEFVTKGNVAVEKLTSGKSGDIRFLQDALQMIFSARLDFFYVPMFG
jgi:hypothetical protein